MTRPLKIKIPPKHPFTVLQDTARLLDDLAKLHPAPQYVRGYSKDLLRAASQIKKTIEMAKGWHDATEDHSCLEESCDLCKALTLNADSQG